MLLARRSLCDCRSGISYSNTTPEMNRKKLQQQKAMANPSEALQMIAVKDEEEKNAYEKLKNLHTNQGTPARPSIHMHTATYPPTHRRSTHSPPTHSPPTHSATRLNTTHASHKVTQYNERNLFREVSKFKPTQSPVCVSVRRMGEHVDMWWVTQNFVSGFNGLGTNTSGIP